MFSEFIKSMDSTCGPSSMDTVHAAAITAAIVPLLTMKVYFEGFPNVGSTYIIVSWDLPTDSNGILINFSLYCNGALAGVLPLTVISYNTTGLLPFTLYMDVQEAKELKGAHLASKALAMARTRGKFNGSIGVELAGLSCKAAAPAWLSGDLVWSRFQVFSELACCSVSGPHAVSWLSVVPSIGLGLHLGPNEYQMAIRWWLARAVYGNGDEKGGLGNTTAKAQGCQ
eukprot:Em0006g1125a